jgi:hypothetical protein
MCSTRTSTYVRGQTKSSENRQASSAPLLIVGLRTLPWACGGHPSPCQIFANRRNFRRFGLTPPVLAVSLHLSANWVAREHLLGGVGVVLYEWSTTRKLTGRPTSQCWKIAFTELPQEHRWINYDDRMKNPIASNPVCVIRVWKPRFLRFDSFERR